MKYDYAVFSDICCDLSAEVRERFEVDGHLKGYISTPQEESVAATLELSDAELDKFYVSLKENSDKYKSSPPSVDEIFEYYEGFLKEKKDVLVLSLTGRLSATYNLMLRAKDMAKEKYPDRTVIVVDSMKYSVALGLLTVKACEFRAKGLTIRENADELDKIKRKLHQMGTVDDLFWVASKGRISKAKAFFGTVAGIKSMGDFDADGMVTPLNKVSGFKKSNKATIEYINRTIVNPEEQIIFVAHSARREQAKVLAALIEEKVQPKEVIICNIHQVSGINIGPGLCAAYYFGEEITDLKREKEILDEIISKL